MSQILRFDPPGRGFFVFLDYVDEHGLPVIFFQGVGSEDAFKAASAILAPLIRQRPELACRTLGAMVNDADSRVCDQCDRQGPCKFALEPASPEGH